MAGNRPPYVRMEVAFGVDPLTRPAAGDWVSVAVLTDDGEAVTDGTALVYDGKLRLHRLRTQRGANVRTGEIETGEASVEIDDLDGVLDPSNSASPFFPDVLPRTRVRFVVGPSDGDEFVVWTGFFKRMPISWRRMLARTTLTAAGLLWLAGDINLPPSVLHQTILDLDPVAYWALAEESGRVVEDLAGTRDGVITASRSAADELVPFAAGGTTAAATVPLAPVSDTAFSYAGWFRAADPLTLWTHRNAGGDVDFTIAVSSTGVTLSASDGSASDSDTAAIEGLLDDAPHFISVSTALITSSLLVARVYVDGELVFQDLGGGLIDDGLFLSVDGEGLMAAVSRAQIGDSTVEGTVGHVAWWNEQVSGASFLSIYEAGTNPWAGDLTGARLGRILDLAGIDAADRDLDAGTVACGPALLDSQSLTDYARKLAATEGGTIFETADGKLAFREHVANDPSPVVTFSDDPDGDNGTPVGPLEPDFSTDRLITAAEVTRENGVTQVASDTAAVARYGRSTLSIDTLHQSPSGARGRANELVFRNNTPRLVFRDVTAHYLDTALATMTSLDVQDAVEVIARPPRGGSPIQQTSIVEQVTHRFERDWVASFGVVEHIVLPWFSWDTTDAGWDQSAWSTTS